MECINRVVENEFADTNANPRAIVIIYKGQLIFERYADYLTKDNKLIGWSATKSVTQAMIGIVSGQGTIDMFEPAPVPEWNQDPRDERQNITIDMMLRMSSGTRWTGDIGPTTQCLYWSDADCAHTSANQPLVDPIDEVYNYNSGSTYILSRIALENRLDPEFNNFEWPKQKLFYPIGAHSMYIEYQPNELFLGGALGYGKPRDWARFGLLFLRDGVWIDGNRVLPPGWVDYSKTPSPTNGGYARHWRRNTGIDEELFFATGFRNQDVFVFPTQELVVVRMAMPAPLYLEWSQGPFLNPLLECFPSAKKN